MFYIRSIIVAVYSYQYNWPEFLFDPALPNEWLISLETDDLDILHVFVELEFIELESLREEDNWES